MVQNISKYKILIGMLTVSVYLLGTGSVVLAQTLETPFDARVIKRTDHSATLIWGSNKRSVFNDGLIFTQKIQKPSESFFIVKVYSFKKEKLLQTLQTQNNPAIIRNLEKDRRYKVKIFSGDKISSSFATVTLPAK